MRTGSRFRANLLERSCLTSAEIWVFPPSWLRQSPSIAEAPSPTAVHSRQVMSAEFDTFDALFDEWVATSDDMLNLGNDRWTPTSLEDLGDEFVKTRSVSPIKFTEKREHEDQCTTAPAKREAKRRRLEPAEQSEYLIDTESRLKATQRVALQNKRSTQLSWLYNDKDEMIGAFCDGQWFARDELMSLSTL